VAVLGLIQKCFDELFAFQSFVQANWAVLQHASHVQCETIPVLVPIDLAGSYDCIALAAKMPPHFETSLVVNAMVQYHVLQFRKQLQQQPLFAPVVPVQPTVQGLQDAAATMWPGVPCMPRRGVACKACNARKTKCVTDPGAAACQFCLKRNQPCTQIDSRAASRCSTRVGTPTTQYSCESGVWHCKDGLQGIPESTSTSTLTFMDETAAFNDFSTQYMDFSTVDQQQPDWMV
jgi:hypothetical protein